jgi:hypothetical protein
LAAIALVAAAFWQNEGVTARALADHGVTTLAFVVQKQQDTDPVPSEGTSQTRYLVTSAYQSTALEDTRTTHRIRHEVPQSVFDSLTVGQSVELIYLPESPRTAEVYPGQHANLRTYLDVLALVAASGATVAALGGFGMARRRPPKWPSRPECGPQ